MRRKIGWLVLTVVIGSFAAVPATASANTITVNTSNDESSAGCTLRDAILASNTNAPVGSCAAGSGAESDTIQFEVEGEWIWFWSDPPAVTGDVEILGPGFEQLNVVTQAGPAFEIASGAAVTIYGLTIQEGSCPEGCGIRNDGNLKLYRVELHDNWARSGSASATPARGAAIVNHGTMTMSGCKLFNNVALSEKTSGSSTSMGGAIYNDGTLTVDRTEINHNRALSLRGDTAVATGGGIANEGQLVVVRSTISENNATSGQATVSNEAEGGGIANADTTAVQVTIGSSTIAENKSLTPSEGSGPGIGRAGGLQVPPSASSFLVTGSTIVGNEAAEGANVEGAPVGELESTILAEPIGGANCSGTLTSLGFNLESADSCGLQPSLHDQVDTDPMLSPEGLAYHIGLGKTIVPLVGSPAIDRGHSYPGESEDESGEARPVDLPDVANGPGSDGTDIGAFEIQQVQPLLLEAPAENSVLHVNVAFFFLTTAVPPGSYSCSLDAAQPTPCEGPIAYRDLSDGPHTFHAYGIEVWSGYHNPEPTDVHFTVDTKPAPIDTTPPVAPIDTTPPVATIVGLAKKTTKRRLAIQFSSSEAGSTFTCQLDKQAPKPCTSPLRTPKLAYGAHRFTVIATDPAGNTSKPASWGFQVIRKHRVRATRHPHHRHRHHRH